MNAQTNNNEAVTVNTTSLLTEFLTALDIADAAEVTRFNATESAIQLLKPIRSQYSTLQDGRSKGKKPAAGELPAVIYFNVIESIYNFKKQAAEEQKQDFTLKYDSYRDFQVKQLKYYIETGDLLNNKKSTLQERALIAIDKLEKKLKAEQAKAEKLAAEKAKADKAKAEAEAEAEKIKSEADEIIEDVHELMDTDPSAAEIMKDELYDVIDDAEASIAEAELAKADATKAADKAKAEADKAEAEAEATQSKLTKAKDRLAKLSRGKADNNETNPDLSEVNFSKDCEAKMQSLLDSMESEFSEAEMLCLSRLIRKRYTPSKA